MLFRRRVKPTWKERVRIWLWPRRSWRRSLSYLKKRVLRLNATPHAIAAGVAAGIFATFTPFIGFHFLLAFAIAYLVAGNMASAALGCGAGNPLTYGPIWASTYEIGRWMLGDDNAAGSAPASLGHVLMNMDIWDIWQPIIKPMLIGGIPLGIGFGLLSYGLVYLAARSFQGHRARRMAEMRERHRQAAVAAAEGVR
ncbi:DUF2062 domain-containing protein [Aureimonas psammosilenae]|uniref:DUF2062 domain-containing protein n=1 Tax=Aureimonas psammosilenae TaxID=2495496 RepID=UPI0012606856|nr:DUF2062 domain-containing protein [Aureimonas psammosilenae]